MATLRLSRPRAYADRGTAHRVEIDVGPDERVELVGEPHDPDSAGGVMKRMFTVRDDYMVLRRAE